MPGIEEETPENLTTCDVEVLVQEIKENLRLSALRPQPSNLTVRNRVKARNGRPSPYQVPSRSRSWGDGCDQCGTSRSCRHTDKNKSDDPYEMLQELLKDGALIKEAVRRLEIGLAPKKRYLYDSDEECRTPLRLCNVDV